MKTKLIIGLVLLFGFSSNSIAQEVTPKELFDKVGEAVFFIMENGEAGLKAMSEKAADNPFIWKDTYVFVFDCSKKILVSHPNQKLIGNKAIWNLKDPKGKYIIRPLCKVAASGENGGWYDYGWPKKQTKSSKTTASSLGDTETIARKISFCIQVPGTSYQAGAGIYNDTLTVKELNAKIKKWMK